MNCLSPNSITRMPVMDQGIVGDALWRSTRFDESGTTGEDVGRILLCIDGLDEVASWPVSSRGSHFDLDLSLVQPSRGILLSSRPWLYAFDDVVPSANRLLEFGFVIGAASPAEDRVSEQLSSALSRIAAEALEEDEPRDVSEVLLPLVRGHGAAVLLDIEQRVLCQSLRRDVAERLVQCIGAMDDPGTHESRRQLLERILAESPSPVIRDNANLGLAVMDDPRSIPAFHKAIAREQSVLLRRLMGQTLAQLEDTWRGSIRAQD